MHKEQIRRLIGKVEQKGYTLVPLNLHWKAGKVKCEIALAKGKAEHDKRDTIRDREGKREVERAMKSGTADRAAGLRGNKRPAPASMSWPGHPAPAGRSNAAVFRCPARELRLPLRHGCVDPGESWSEHIPDLRRYARSLTGDALGGRRPGAGHAGARLPAWQLGAGSDLRAWLFTLMHNLFLDGARRAVRRRLDRVDIDDVAHELARRAARRTRRWTCKRCLHAPAGRTARGAAAGDPAGHGLRGGGADHGRADRHRDVAPVARARPPARPDGGQARAGRAARRRRCAG